MLYSCKQVHKHFCQGWGRNTNARSCDCLALGVPMNNNLSEEDSENNNLPVLLRRHNICPERCYRNAGVLNFREMARLLESRVFNAGCSVLGGHVAVLLARLGIGALRLCDPDVFEESDLNRQYFCTEQTLGSSKVLACRDDLLGMASHMEIDAHEVAANPENLPELLFGCDAVVDCLDSIPRRRCSKRPPVPRAFPLCLALFLATRALPSGPSLESCASQACTPTSCLATSRPRGRASLRQPRPAQPVS